MASYKRPSGYTEELGELICLCLEEGRSIRDAAVHITENGTEITESTIRRWGRDAQISSKEFVTQYARAREAGAHTEFDNIRDLEQEVRDGVLDPQQGRVIIDSVKWRLSKMLPRSYGDRQTIEHQGDVKTRAIDHAPEWIIERLEALKAAREQQSDEEAAAATNGHDRGDSDAGAA